MKYLVIIFSFLFTFSSNSQTVKGKITSGNNNISFASIMVDGAIIGVSSDVNGDFKIDNIPLGNQYLIVSAVNMEEKRVFIDVKKGVNLIDIALQPSLVTLNQVVITGTRTSKKKIDSPVIVNVINSSQLDNVQACNLAEGLKFQSGLRVENDCQTCNYTQLRMNGLAGGYSQILINGRAIFSPLTGLYGMEQIPVNMIDRIEIVKGGGSALYGSSAIGGVVNIITKVPKFNSYSFGYKFGLINKDADDRIISANTTVLSENRKSGATIFVNNRKRMPYDHNNDQYSELPELNDNTFGANFFFFPSDNSKLEINLGSLNEYRYGGEMVDGVAHFAMQSEERVHDIFLCDLDYKIYFNDKESSLITFLAIQNTNREHYTGIRPEIGSLEDSFHLTSPPYGTSFNITKQAGFQLNHNIKNLVGTNILTAGFEYLSDEIIDKIPAYNYLIDQRVVNLGTFIQSDWDLNEHFNLLSGARIDKHSMLSHFIFSPRFSLLYKFKKNTQLRMSYSTGFRAPQAFDTDLHISFAGGGVSRIILADDLMEERSRSFSTSINYDKLAQNYIYGFTLQGFYTRLNNAFFQDPAGEDEFGEVFVKRNGNSAIVQGVTLDFRFNFNQKFQLESGITYQKSEYNEPIVYSLDLPLRKEFLRTPEKYAFATLDYFVSEKLNFTTNLVYTGPMDLVHMAGAPGQTEDMYFQSKSFNEIGFKLTYVQKLKKVAVKIEYSLGVKNITNDYQNNFDTSKNRDSNFVYGPQTPRIFYFGLLLKSL